MSPVAFVSGMHNTHAVFCSKIADVHGNEVHEVGVKTVQNVIRGLDLKICWFSANFPIFGTHQVCLAKFGEICLQKSLPFSAELLYFIV